MKERIRAEFDKWKFRTIVALVVGFVALCVIIQVTHHQPPMWVPVICFLVPVGFVQVWHWREDRDDV